MGERETTNGKMYVIKTIVCNIAEEHSGFKLCNGC